MVRYLKSIDCHVHLRGKEYPNHNFLALAFRDAHAVGLCALGEQPNPRPELTTPEKIKSRLILAQNFAKDIFHWIHIGMTNDMTQNEQSLRAVMQGIHRLRSDKTFNTHSTGNMGILEADQRRALYQLKGEIMYQGVSCTHCENDKYFKREFEAIHPETHSIRQDEESEVISVEETIKNANDANFRGTVYICHASSPLTIEYVTSERPHLPFRVILEETWHHIFLNADEDYPIHGNLVKMNPPLRSKKSQERILEYILQGKIDVIGSDHAPHPHALKLSDKPPSGIPALPFWPKGVELLRKQGITETVLENLIFYTANDIFNLGQTPQYIDCSYVPELWSAYGWNPFSRIDNTNR